MLELMWKLVAVFAFLPCLAHADDRLLGTWKSDRIESMRFSAENALLEPRQTKFLNQILGHLELSFDGQKSRSYMPDIEIESKGKPTTFFGEDATYGYRVLGSDLDSVSIFVEKKQGRDRIMHLHFVDDNTFWIYTEESSYELRELNTREYFHRK